MTNTNLLVQFDPLDPTFLTGKVWNAPILLQNVVRVCVMVRESTKMQSQDTGIITQLILAKDFAIKNNMQIVSVYSIRYSGLKIERHNLFQEMKSRLFNQEYDLLFIKSISRLTRNIKLGLNFVEDLALEYKIRVVAPLDEFDTDKLDWDEVLNKKIQNYNEESRTKSKLQKLSRSVREQFSEYMGSFAPYGLVKQQNDKLAPATDGSAEIVKQIFQWASLNNSPHKIAKNLTDMEVPTPSERNGSTRISARWYDTTVRKILKNRIYCGDIVGLKSNVIVLGKSNRRYIPEDQRKVSYDVIPAIVSKEVFDLVQNLLEERGNGKKGSVVDIADKSDILGDKLYCFDCKKPMHKIKRGYGNVHYVCSIHNKRAKLGYQCTGRHSIMVDSLKNMLMNEIKEVLLSASNELISSGFHQTLRKMDESYRSQLTSIKRELRNLDNRIDRVTDDKYDGKITEIQAAKTINRYTSKIADLQKQKDIINNKISSCFLQSKPSNTTILELLNDPETLIKALIGKIEVDVNGNIQCLTFNFQQPSYVGVV